MKIDRFSGGSLGTNCYFLTDEETGQIAVIDPGFVSGRMERYLAQAGASNVVLCLLTHGHFDHIGGVDRLRELTEAKICLPRGDAAFPADPALNLGSMLAPGTDCRFRPDRLLDDGDTVRLGNLSIRTLHTPGHTAGSSSFVAGDALFSGDTLMEGSVGRTDFPTGSWGQMTSSLKKLAALSGNYRVYPGHGESTTLEEEKKFNPFLKEAAGESGS